jgi:putative toxin-antitoxin system antitoxin component (TIGR02293 family)
MVVMERSSAAADRKAGAARGKRRVASTAATRRRVVTPTTPRTTGVIGATVVVKDHAARPRGGSPAVREPARIVEYDRAKGVDDFVRQVARATPLQLVEVERRGVAGRFLKDLAARLDIPAVRVFDMLGVPKATVEKKSAAGDLVSGSGGQAAIGLARLIGIAQAILANSTAQEAKGFDAARWLGRWLDRPQPSLAGRRPADLIDTPTGIDLVARLLGAIESGAYQ